jgi:hypothetical protein
LTYSLFSIKIGIFVFRDLIDVIKNESSSKFSSLLFLYFFSYRCFYFSVK